MSTLTLTAGEVGTEFTLEKPARVPGAQLKPGTYKLRVLDHLADRLILEIRDDRHASPVTTFLAVPDANLPRFASGTAIYWPRSGHTAAIRGMWLPGAKSGVEFVFPKADAAKLAVQVGSPVPAIDPDSEGKKAVSKMNDSDRRIVTLWVLSPVAVTPGGKEVGIQAAKFVPQQQTEVAKSEVAKTEVSKVDVPVASEQPVQEAAETSPASPTRARMPKTAGNFASSLMAGLMCVVLGSSFRLISKNRS